jgi:hypothetical protein
MNAHKNNDLLSKRNIRFAAGFVMVALVAGIYFLFRPFPAGPSLEAAAGLNEAASVKGWSAYANAPVSLNSASTVPSSVREFILSQQRNFAPLSVNSASSIQKLDIGAGYVLETGSQGTKVIAPITQASAFAARESALVPSFVLEVSSQDQQGYVPARLGDIASVQEPGLVPSFVLEVSSHAELGFASILSASSAPSIQRLEIGNGYVLENSRSNSRIVAPSAPYIVAPVVAASATQRLDIGNGYMLENSAQGSMIVPPIVPVKLAATVTNADYLKKIDIGSGYMLVMGPESHGEIVPTP